MKNPSTTEAPVEIEISYDREDDGRWIAEVVALPGLLAYGATQEEARAKAQAIAAEIIREQATKI
jgi:predicted RNase H-like HicB family nuclease